MNILSVRLGHDSGAALIQDGAVVADVAEERFTRVKVDASFPVKSITYCLEFGGISSEEIDILVIPSLTFQEHFFAFFNFPENFKVTTLGSTKSETKKTGITSLFQKSSSPELQIGFFETEEIKHGRPAKTVGGVPVLPVYQKPWKLSEDCQVFLVEHHMSHAASACYTSGWNDEKALCVTMDGCGDSISTAIWSFEDKKLSCLQQWTGESSLGWFYALGTEAIGWRQSMDEWKVMGLAPFGKPQPGKLKGLHPVFENGELKEPFDFGEFGRWNEHGANHYHNEKCKLFSSAVDELGMENFAAEVQRISEEQGMNLIEPWLKKLGTRNLLCAGGYFLNVKFNQKIWATGKLDKHWVYPNSGDGGLPVGAGLLVWHHTNPKEALKPLDNFYKGPGFTNDEIKTVLDDRLINYSYHENIEEKTAELLEKNYVIGWFQGRMEVGPRALGGRSIIMSPLREENRDIINKKIKYRETFRPFCPAMLHEHANEYLVSPRDAEYMVISFETKPGAKKRIPAAVHIDETARPQMVKRERHPRYYDMIKAFGDRTNEYVILNTSFNIKGEPIVCNPRDALKCFYDTGMDALVLGNFLIEKSSVN